MEDKPSIARDLAGILPFSISVNEYPQFIPGPQRIL
jgi:hypothetical protein